MGKSIPVIFNMFNKMKIDCQIRKYVWIQIFGWGVFLFIHHVHIVFSTMIEKLKHWISQKEKKILKIVVLH